MFGKFMNKKFFHPGSYPNEKRKWIREQKVSAAEKVEKETQALYRKEQESYQSRKLSAKTEEERMKLDLNFLYDLPPGMKMNKLEEESEEVDEDGEKKEKEYKFEWQKHAPRSKYVKELDLDCQDQPFGVCVKNIRCFTCKAWGHQNTDRECPMFFSNVGSEAHNNANVEASVKEKNTLRLSDPLLLVNAMKEHHGLTLKKSVIGKEIDPMADMADNQRILHSDGEEGDELDEADMRFVESLTNKQKRKLLRRLNKIEKRERKKKKKKRKKSRGSDSSDDDGDGNESDSSNDERNTTRDLTHVRSSRKRRDYSKETNTFVIKNKRRHSPEKYKADGDRSSDDDNRKMERRRTFSGSFSKGSQHTETSSSTRKKSK